MTHPNASASTTNINDIIAAGLAAVTEEQLGQAPVDTKPRPENVPQIGVAGESEKRLFWYHKQLVSDKQTLEEQLAVVGKTIFGDSKPKLLGPVLLKISEGGLTDKIKEFATLEQQIDMMEALSKRAAALFWQRAEESNPALRDKDCQLHSDWTFSMRPTKGIGVPAGLLRALSRGAFHMSVVDAGNLAELLGGADKPN